MKAHNPINFVTKVNVMILWKICSYAFLFASVVLQPRAQTLSKETLEIRAMLCQ